MGNAIQSTVAADITVTTVIPQYVADGYTGTGDTRTLTFSGGAPPTDGSQALCVIIIDSATGIHYKTGAYLRLLCWADTMSGKAQVAGSDFVFVQVPNWSFLADANNSDT